MADVKAEDRETKVLRGQWDSGGKGGPLAERKRQNSERIQTFLPSLWEQLAGSVIPSTPNFLLKLAAVQGKEGEK